MAELIQKKLQGEVEKYQQLQKDLSKSVSGRQTLEVQLTENNIMKEELALLDGSNVVFKLLGPILVNRSWGNLGPQWVKGWTTSQLRLSDMNPSSGI